MAENQKGVPGLNRSLSSNSCWLRSSNHVKFTVECEMCSGNHVSVKKNVYECTKRGFATQSLAGKDSPRSEKQTDSPIKKKFLAQWSIKKVMLTVFWKEPSLLLSLKKGATINNFSYCQFLWPNSLRLLNKPNKFLYHIFWFILLLFVPVIA